MEPKNALGKTHFLAMATLTALLTPILQPTFALDSVHINKAGDSAEFAYNAAKDLLKRLASNPLRSQYPNIVSVCSTHIGNAFGLLKKARDMLKDPGFNQSKIQEARGLFVQVLTNEDECYEVVTKGGNIDEKSKHEITHGMDWVQTHVIKGLDALNGL